MHESQLFQIAERARRSYTVAFICMRGIYVPRDVSPGVASNAIVTIERIGRGQECDVRLVAASQRPARLNHTVVSPSNNSIAMQQTKGDGQK